MFYFFCCAHDECVKMADGKLLPAMVQIAMGKDGKTHAAAIKHLRSVHGIVGQEPGNVKAKRQVEEQSQRKVNAQKKRFWLPSEKRWVTLHISAKGLRTIDKRGIERVVADIRATGQKV